MSHEAPQPSANNGRRNSGGGEASVGQLVTQLSENTSRLVRDELQLAKVELAESAKRAGVGAGMLGAAGVLAHYGLGLLLATAVVALGLLLPWWLSVLIVTVVVFLIAAVLALMGKKKLQQASPTPERTIKNLKRDVAEVKEARS